MPSSFWKGHREEEELPLHSLSSLREKYIEDGRKVAEHLRKEHDVLAIWLSGPFGYSRVSPTSDLHLAVLIPDGREPFYHHQLPPFSEVGRRLEIAFFPLHSLQLALERGYQGWSTVFDLHKLKEVVILYERKRILSQLKKGLQGIKPAKLFIGREIEALRLEIDLMGRLLDEGKYRESLLNSRQILWHALELLLLIKKSRTFSKLSDLYPQLRSQFSSPLAEEFAALQGTEGVDGSGAERKVKMARSLVNFILEKEGI